MNAVNSLNSKQGRYPGNLENMPTFTDDQASIPENSPVFKRWERERNQEVGIPENSPVFKRWERERNQEVGIPENSPVFKRWERERDTPVSIDPIEGGRYRPRCPSHHPIGVNPPEEDLDTPVHTPGFPSYPTNPPVGINPPVRPPYLINPPISVDPIETPDTPISIDPIENPDAPISLDPIENPNLPIFWDIGFPSYPINQPIGINPPEDLDTPISISPIETPVYTPGFPSYPTTPRNEILELTQNLSEMLDALPDGLADQILAALPGWMQALVKQRKTPQITEPEVTADV